MRTSSRGEVDPFIVMDVMEAARAEEARGRLVIHMEVGQPGHAGAGAPRAPRWSRAMERGAARLHRGARAAGAAGADRAALPRLVRGRARSGAGGGDGRARRPASSSPSPASSTAATGWRSASRAIRATATSCRRSTSSRSASPTAAEHRFQPVPADLPDGLAGLLVASPANPTGTMLDRAALAALIGRRRSAGSPSSRTRSTTASSTAGGRSRRWRSATRSTSSTRSRSTSR